VQELMLHKTKLFGALESLSKQSRICFAASCCERLIPNYRAFWKLEKWGDANRLDNTVDLIWAHLEGQEFSSQQINELMALLETIGPDTEDFISLWTGPAVDAVGAVISTLQCCIDGDATHAVAVGWLAVESVYHYLSVVNDPELDVHQADPSFERFVLEAPLMNAELQKQLQDLALLESINELSNQILRHVRISSHTMGIQPFRRRLLPNGD
jgi:uncharacterized protein YjaG (DUF416 family)